MPAFRNAFSPNGSSTGMTLGCAASAQDGTGTESTPAPTGARQNSTPSQSMDSSFEPMTPGNRNLKLHSLTDLIKCEWMGDSEKDMKQYRNTAREIMDSIPENIIGRNEEIIKQQFQTALADQMLKSKDSLIIADMVHYNRAMTESDVKGDYCYDYLWRRLNTRIKLFHQKDMISQWKN